MPFRNEDPRTNHSALFDQPSDAMKLNHRPAPAKAANHAARLPRRAGVLPGLVIAGLGVLLTGALALWVAQIRRSDYFHEFAATSLERARDVEDAFRLQIAAQQGINGLFAASKEVKSHEFTRFIRTLYGEPPLTFRYFGFIERVPHARRAAFEEAIREDYGPQAQEVREWSPDGQLQPAAERTEYYPVRFLEPRTGSDEIIGWDLASDPARAAALAKATATGAPAMAGPVRIPDAGDNLEFRVYIPIYALGGVDGIPPGQSLQVVGFSAGASRYGDILNSVLGRREGFDCYIEVFAADPGDAGADPTPLYTTRTPRATGGIEWAHRAAGQYLVKTTVNLADIRETYHFIPARDMRLLGFMTAEHRALALAGFMLSLIMGWLGALLTRARLLRRLEEDRLRLYATIFQDSQQAIVITDAAANILEVNPAYTRITGYGSEEAVGRNPRLLQSGHHDRDFYHELWRTLRAQGWWEGEFWNRRKNGALFGAASHISAIKDADGVPRWYVGLFSDVTRRMRSRERLERMASFDTLTNLPNRTLFMDRLGTCLARARRQPRWFAVGFLDLDGFKEVNDEYGHRTGDWVLAAVSERLVENTRAQDTVARFGGDEFVLLLTDLSGASDCRLILERVLRSFAAPLILTDGTRIEITASIGFTLYPDDPGKHDPDVLLDHADQAMYAAKEAGKQCLKQYESATDRPTTKEPAAT